MKKLLLFTQTLLSATLLLCTVSAQAQLKSTGGGIPELIKTNGVTQLHVNNKPFLILGGELNNSSSSSLTYMKPIWKQVKALNFNTLLTPLSWDIIEPSPGIYHFGLVDSLITEARQNDIHLVFLWLASWKNGMSSYAPLWVKQNYKRFLRAKIKNGQTMEVLTPLGKEACNADATAFAALMKHIKEVDGDVHTVLMIQVENEVGILDDSRDRSEIANQAFNNPVPKSLLSYLQKNKDKLVPEIKSLWQKNGFKTSGNWETIFGKGVDCDELFMAWHYAGYVNEVAAAGKKEYPIPMYTNAWLDQGIGPKPGDYPSGGPVARVLDIWKANAPNLDLLAPDVYVAEYDARCQKFTQLNNPLFIPEMNSNDEGAHNIFIAIGKYAGIGVSPFGIDRLRDAENSGFTKSYQVLGQLAPIILQKQVDQEIIGFVVTEDHPAVEYEMGGYRLRISLDEIFGHRAKTGYGTVMLDNKDSFIGAGSGFRVQFYPLNKSDKIIGVADIEEGAFSNGNWQPGRRLNGDENDQGRAWRFSPWSVAIEKCRVYTYQ